MTCTVPEPFGSVDALPMSRRICCWQFDGIRAILSGAQSGDDARAVYVGANRRCNSVLIGQVKAAASRPERSNESGQRMAQLAGALDMAGEQGSRGSAADTGDGTADEPVCQAGVMLCDRI